MKSQDYVWCFSQGKAFSCWLWLSFLTNIWSLLPNEFLIGNSTYLRVLIQLNEAWVTSFRINASFNGTLFWYSAKWIGSSMFRSILECWYMAKGLLVKQLYRLQLCGLETEIGLQPLTNAVFKEWRCLIFHILKTIWWRAINRGYWRLVLGCWQNLCGNHFFCLVSEPEKLTKFLYYWSTSTCRTLLLCFNVCRRLIR